MRRGESRSYLDNVELEEIKQRFDAFWNREVIDRPVLRITAPRPSRRLRSLRRPERMKDQWTNAEYVVEKAEAELDATVFLGDALPFTCRT